MEELGFVAGIDHSGFDADIKHIEQGVSQTAKKVEQSGMSVDEFAKHMQGVVSSFDRLTQAVDRNTETITKSTTDATIAIDKQGQSVNNLSGRFVKFGESGSSASQSVRMRLRELTQQIVELTLEYRSMGEEERNSLSGQELEKKIAKLTSEAGVLKDAFGDATREINGLASDTSKWDALGEGLNVAASALGGAAGAASLLGAEEEDLQRIQTALQASLATSNALSVMQNKLQKESSLMIAIRAVQESAAAKAIAVRTAAEGKGIIATKAATLAQTIFNTVAKANPYLLLFTAITTLVGGVYLLTKSLKANTDRHKEAAEAARRHAEEVSKMQQQWADSVASSASQQLVAYRRLQSQWNALGDDLNAKKKFIDDNKSAFNSLGWAVNSVSDAESLLVGNTDAVVNAIMARAKAAAYAETAKQIEGERIREMLRQDTASGDYKFNYRKGSKITRQTLEKRYGKDAGRTLLMGTDFTWEEGLTESGVQKMEALEQRRVKAAQDAKKQRIAIKEDEGKKVEALLSKELQAEQKAIAETGVKAYAPIAGSGTGAHGGTEVEHTGRDLAARIQEERRYQEELAKIQIEAADARRDAELAAIEDDGERERAEQDEQHKRNIRQIEQQADEMKKAVYEHNKKVWENAHKDSPYELTEEGKAGWKGLQLSDDQQAIIDAQLKKENAEYERHIADRRQAEQDAMTAYLKDFGTAEQQRLAIAQEYDKKIAESRTEGERNTLVAQKEQALQAHDLEQQQKTMDMESLFNNLGQMSLDKLNQAKEELRGMLSAQNLGMDDYKTIAEQIDKVEDAIVAKQKQKKGLLGALIPGETTVQRLKRQQAEAEEQVKAATEKVVELQQQLAGQKLGIFSMLSAGGANYKGDISAANRGAIMDAARNAGFSPEKIEELEKAMDGLVVTTDNLNNANKNEEEAKKKVSEKQMLLGEAVGNLQQKVSDFAASLETINANIQALPALMDSLGLGNTGAGQAVSSVASAANNAMGAMADFASGNYVGAAVKAVGAVKDVAAVFGPDNTAKMQAKIDELNNHSDALAMAMKSLQKAFENSYGINAMENAEKQRQLLESQQRDAQMAMVYEARKHGANRSTLNASVNDNKGWQDAMKIVSQILGKNVRESGNDFLQLSASEMQKIIDYDNGELWNKILAEYRSEGGKGGRSDQLADMLQSYVDDFGSAFEDLDNMVNEKLTNTTKENVLDDFKQSLYDLAGGSEDVFDNIEQNWQQMINQMVIDNLILKDVQDDLEKWYERLAQLQKDRNNGIIDNKAYQDALEALKGDYTDIMKGAQQTVNDFTEWGIIKPLEEAAEDVSTAFGNLRDTFKDSLLDMESDADAFRKNLQRTLYEDLIEKNVFDVPFTINGMTFDDFEAYSKDWNERYAKAVADGDTAALDALIEELVEARKITAAAAESYREALKNLEETAKDTTFKDMGGSWVSMLMGMDSDAETWGKEIGRTMAQKIIEQMILADTMQPLLDTLQDNFNRAMGEGSSWEEVLADEGVNAALADIEKAYPELQKTVNTIMDRLGLSVDEEAKQGFSDLRSLMTSALLDTEGDMETFGKSMAETMMKQMLDTMIDSKYKKRMDNISKEWAEALDAADPARIDAVKQQVMDLYEEVGKDSEIKQLTEDIKALAEGVDDTTTPFDNLRSSYHSWLMDMTKDTKDFTEDINKMLADAFVDEFVMGKGMDDIIEKYKGQFKSIRDDATLSKEERARQMKALGGLIAEEAEGLKAETKEVLSWFGLSNNVEDQGAAMNMAESATYDQFELYLGIATAQQINGEQQLSIQQQILATLQSMTGITSPGGETVKEISSRMRTANEYLLSIRDSNKAILDTMSRKLDVINANLSRL